MRKTKGFLILAGLTLLFTACEESRTYSPEAVITSYSMGNFPVIYHDINIQGHDTLVTRTVSGSTIEFTIDQQRNLIFNRDSLPLGSKVDSVKTTIYSSGLVMYRKMHNDGTYTDTLWSSSDPMDLTRPVTLLVISDDDSYTRQYTLTTNIHTVDPDSMTWRHTASLPATISGMKAVMCRGSVTVLGKDDSGSPCIIRRQSDGWTGPLPCIGLDGNVITRSLTRHDGRLAVVDGNRVMTSEDGITWSEAGQDTPLSYLIPFTQTGDAGQAWAVSEDGWLVSSSDLISWTRVQQLPQTFPDMDMTGICYPLRTNSSIIRYIIAGIDTDRKATHASLWTKLSNEQYWTEVETADGHSLYCPAFENLAMILYDDNLFAFGGSSVINGLHMNPMQGFYQSSDNGITWRDCNAFYDSFNTWNPFMKFPSELRGCTDPFCYTVDDNGCIWIITAGEKGVWKGYINRLYNADKVIR